MAQTNINIRIDETDKRLFDEICGQLRITMTTAVNLRDLCRIRREWLA